VTLQHIDPFELSSVLTLNFKADKSSGLSQMPLHLLKHMGPEGTACLAELLNVSAINQLPPKSWRTSKVTPLYKGKGDMTLPDNYRSIAVTPHAKAANLHAPTQAGFREYHSTIEHALIL
jgi:hypothetical protein